MLPRIVSLSYCTQNLPASQSHCFLCFLCQGKVEMSPFRLAIGEMSRSDRVEGGLTGRGVEAERQCARGEMEAGELPGMLRIGRHESCETNAAV